MDAVAVAKGLFAVTELRDMDKAAEYLSDNFTCHSHDPEPFGKVQWLKLHAELLDAFPDWAFNVSEARQQGNVVQLTIQITGTHSRDLSLASMGLSTIKATGRAVKLPLEHLEVAVEGDKVVSLRVDIPPGAGMPGILKQLGVEMPSSRG